MLMLRTIHMQCEHNELGYIQVNSNLKQSHQSFPEAKSKPLVSNKPVEMISNAL